MGKTGRGTVLGEGIRILFLPYCTDYSSLYALSSEFYVAGFFVSFRFHLNITSSEISSLITPSQVASQPFSLIIWKVLADIISIIYLLASCHLYKIRL